MVTMVLIPSLASLGRYGGYLFPRLSCFPQVICDLRGEVSFRYNIYILLSHHLIDKTAPLFFAR